MQVVTAFESTRHRCRVAVGIDRQPQQAARRIVRDPQLHPTGTALRDEIFIARNQPGKAVRERRTELALGTIETKAVRIFLIVIAVFAYVRLQT